MTKRKENFLSSDFFCCIFYLFVVFVPFAFVLLLFHKPTFLFCCCCSVFLPFCHTKNCLFIFSTHINIFICHSFHDILYVFFMFLSLVFPLLFFAFFISFGKECLPFFFYIHFFSFVFFSFIFLCVEIICSIYENAKESRTPNNNYIKSIYISFTEKIRLLFPLTCDME